MLHVIYRSIMVALLTGATLLVAGFDTTLAAGMDPSPEETFVTQCTSKVEKWFSFITIQSQELALDRIRFMQRPQIIVIPLKAPHGSVTAIRWHPKDTSEGMEFIRYLQTGKIGAVNVLPFRHHPADVYVADRELREKLKDCQKEQILEAFGTCSECEVMEWLNLKP